MKKSTYDYGSRLASKIHPSHKMSDWEDTIVTLVSTSRFGGLRKCINCDAEHARTVAGEAAHDELYEKCREI